MAVVRFDRLPRTVFETLFQLEPGLAPVFLGSLGSSELHRRSLEIVYENIKISDRTPWSAGPAATIIARPDIYAPAVRSLEISPSADLGLEQASPGADEWDAGLVRFLSLLTHLRSFRWSCDRTPFVGLCPALGSFCSGLEVFRLELPCSSRRSQSTHLNEESDLDLESSQKPLRWDSSGLEGLPPSLTELSLSSLAINGVKALSKALDNLTWSALTRLKISKTLFFDDDLTNSIVLGAKKLKFLTIESMAGTKFTDRGISELLNGLDGLKEINLTDVDGRFSRCAWLKFDDLPASLRSVRFKYHENGLYHSWTLDHLEHIFSLLSLYPQQLEVLSIERCVPMPALLPGRHEFYPELGVSSRTLAKKITKDQIMQIVEEGQNLKELVIDWWLISVEGLEVIVRGLSNLVKLRVMVDAPFHRIISSTAFLHSKIRTLIISIPPEHTPFLRDMALGLSSPTDKTTSSSLSSASPILPTNQAACGAASAISSPIPTRDLKKFIKRAGQLQEIVWTGRGGIGTWKFHRNSGSAVNVRVKFIPIVEELGDEVHEQIARQESGQATRYRTGSWITKNRNCQSVKRRRSSVTTNGERSAEDCPSRRSSMGSSLDTSWSSSYLGAGLCSSAGRSHFQSHQGLIGLEGIPGTPHNEAEVCQPKIDDLSSSLASDQEWVGVLEKRVQAIQINGS